MVSKKQEEILNYMNKTINTKGYSPTVREICEAVGLKSTSTVQYHLKKLINLGYLNKSNPDSISLRLEHTYHLPLPLQ